MNLLELLKNNHFDNHMEKLKRKYKNKKILLAGINDELKIFLEVSDMSGFNVIGIADLSRKSTQEKALTLGGPVKYPIIKYNDIKNVHFDIILIIGMDTFSSERLLYDLKIKNYDLLTPAPLNVKIQQTWNGGY